MKNVLAKASLVLGIALGLVVVPGAAQARHWDDGIYISVGGGGGHHCKWVPGHKHHGVWVPGQRVCYGYPGYHNKRCYWVGGYWHHGIYYPARKVCRW